VSSQTTSLRGRAGRADSPSCSSNATFTRSSASHGIFYAQRQGRTSFLRHEPASPSAWTKQLWSTIWRTNIRYTLRQPGREPDSTNSSPATTREPYDASVVVARTSGGRTSTRRADPERQGEPRRFCSEMRPRGSENYPDPDVIAGRLSTTSRCARQFEEILTGSHWP